MYRAWGGGVIPPHMCPRPTQGAIHRPLRNNPNCRHNLIIGQHG